MQDWGILPCNFGHFYFATNSHFANREIDWFYQATEAIKALAIAGNVAEERTPDALDVARFILDKSLSWISDVIIQRCQDKVGDWVFLLKELRSSFIWTCHYGYGEAETNFSFEFPIWEKQTKLPSMRSKLRPIFMDCAKSYDDALSLKGGLRGEHFLKLAALAARCGFKSDSELWLKRGIETTLAYGYRKDITLENLIDVLSCLGKYRPEKVLENAAAILEMIKWIPSATDGRSTKHFAQYLLPTIVTHNRAAALEVLRTYYKEFAPGQANESVTKYILTRKGGDPEFLWALCGLLDPNESLEPRQHVVNLATSLTPNTSAFWENRLSRYTRIMINPRHWPDRLWEKATKMHERPVRQRRDENQNYNNLNDQTYALEGEQITLDEVKQRCHISFNEMAKTIKMLEQENDYVPNYDLFPILIDYINHVTSINDLSIIKSFLKEHLKGFETKYWEVLGRKYLDLGDISSGLECLEQEISEATSSTLSTSEALSTLIESDRERAKAFMVQNITKRLQDQSYHGFHTPNIIAKLCDLLGKDEELETIFNDFLHHCQDLFAQWPKDRSFDELRNWGDTDRNEEVQVVHLLVDQLTSPLARLGDRLVCTLCMLAETCGEKVFPILAEQLTSSSGLQLWRLLQIFARLSYSNRLLFQKYCHALIPLLDQGDFFLTLVASRAIQGAYIKTEPLPDKIKQSLEKIDRRYFSMIYYRGFKILGAKPSAEFIELIKIAALIPFRQQLEATCQILNVDMEFLIAHLERRVLETGTTLAEEKESTMSMRGAYAHAQGWPMLPFVPNFHTQISKLFYQTIDELLLKQKYQPKDLEAVWRIIQPNDPEYSFAALSPMPEDIVPLLVKSKDNWIAADKPGVIVTVVDTFTEEWIIAFEFRELAQDNPYHCEFITQTYVRSALIIPEKVQDITSFDPQSWGEMVDTYHPDENLTWQQFREALLNGHKIEPNGNEPCLPFTSYKEKNAAFLGFHTITSLASKIIREQKLRFDGFSVFAGEKCVACFEAWQEGYSDEDYNDNPLSFGVRLRVNTGFIKQVCKDMGRAFAIQTTENRFILKEYQLEASDSCSYTSIHIYPADIATTDF